MNMISRTQQLLLLAFALVVASAFGQDVHYNYDRGTNFAAYKSYQWVNTPGAAPDQFVDRDIKRAVDEQLVGKGLTKVEKNPDLFITYQAAVRVEKSIDLASSGGPFGGWVGGGDTVRGQTATIPIGTLMVGIYDAGKKELIWRADVSKTIDLQKDPDKNYKNLQKAAAKLFKNYPPQPGR